MKVKLISMEGKDRLKGLMVRLCGCLFGFCVEQLTLSLTQFSSFQTKQENLELIELQYCLHILAIKFHRRINLVHIHKPFYVSNQHLPLFPLTNST